MEEVCKQLGLKYSSGSGQKVSVTKAPLASTLRGRIGERSHNPRAKGSTLFRMLVVAQTHPIDAVHSAMKTLVGFMSGIVNAHRIAPQYMKNHSMDIVADHNPKLPDGTHINVLTVCASCTTVADKRFRSAGASDDHTLPVLQFTSSLCNALYVRITVQKMTPEEAAHDLWNKHSSDIVFCVFNQVRHRCDVHSSAKKTWADLEPILKKEFPSRHIKQHGGDMPSWDPNCDGWAADNFVENVTSKKLHQKYLQLRAKK